MVIKRRNTHQKLFNKVIIYVCACLLVGFSIFPVFWMISTSFKPTEEIYQASIQWIPQKLSTMHYERVIFHSPFNRYFVNSLIITSGVTILSIIIAILSAYALTRFRFFGQKILFGLVTLSRAIPVGVIVIPLFILGSRMRIIDTYVGLIFGYLAITVPFSVWLLSGFFHSVPKELEDAAMIEGCNRLQVLYRIVVPICIPSIIAVAVVSFRIAWSEFFLGLVLSRTGARPAAVGLIFYEVEELVDYGAMMSASTLMFIPIMLIFLICGKYLIKGLGEGAVKG